MRPIWIERLLQPRYAWNYIKRKFWRYISHHRWMDTLYGAHGWRMMNGKLTYFED